MYDLGSYVLAIYRKTVFRERERLTSEKLRSREEQRLAVMVPAWNEGDVVGTMVANIIERAEYKNYVIFVGTYPNDAATQAAVDALAAIHPQLIKVVIPNPGPTCKADCLNNVYKTIKRYEEKHGINFDMIAMHDAEDVVHPYGFALYNYLIPRVDAIQLPILPLPTSHKQFVHWIYADEFCENHMKDVPVREKISGFVPFAGVGTGFSRRVFHALEQVSGDEIFNEKSMAEDYSMSKKLRMMGLKTIFVNLVLGDDESPWWTPLCKRPGFISNWAYFPMDFKRSVRQKTRWIIGISLQEWEHSGWGPDPKMYESLVKDRKVFAAALASFIGYIVLGYMVVSQLGLAGIVPFKLLPLIVPHTPLFYVMYVATVIMTIRLAQRLIIISRVYGVAAGFMSLLRIPVSNYLNGLAAFRALQAFARSRQGLAPVKWDKTQHVEGVGSLPTNPMGMGENKRVFDAVPFAKLMEMLNSDDRKLVIQALNAIPRNATADQQRDFMAKVDELVKSTDTQIRGTLAKSLGFLQWRSVMPHLVTLLRDEQWLVRANAVKALFKQAEPIPAVETLLATGDNFAMEVIVRTVEQDRLARQLIFARAAELRTSPIHEKLIQTSIILSAMYQDWCLTSDPVEDRRIELSLKVNSKLEKQHPKAA